MNNLIICPVGSPISYDNRFDKENHWRLCKKERLWETVVFQYSDFVPEPNSYDKLIVKKGLKWKLSKEYLNSIDYSKYTYIGFMDDDLITDIDNINKAINIAIEKNLKIFQLSVTEDSDMFYRILKNKSGVKYTTTNFNEVMGPFIHTSLIPLCLELWNEYDLSSGWGFDKVLCDLTKTDAAVIHSSQMYHPKRYGNYDKSKAFAEMDHLLNNIFPSFMKRKYNEDWSFIDQQREKTIVM
jgi:hypothetical protein